MNSFGKRAISTFETSTAMAFALVVVVGSYAVDTKPYRILVEKKVVDDRRHYVQTYAAALDDYAFDRLDLGF